MSEVEPKVYLSKRSGLGLTVKAEERKWDELRKEYIVIPGVYIKFADSRYVADTKEKIDYLDNYCKKKPDQAWPISKKSEKFIKAAKKVQEEEEAEKKKAAKKKGQGVIGQKTTADPTDGEGKKGQGSFA